MDTCKIKYDDIGFVIHVGPQHIVYYLYYFNHCSLTTLGFLLGIDHMACWTEGFSGILR